MPMDCNGIPLGNDRIEADMAFRHEPASATDVLDPLYAPNGLKPTALMQDAVWCEKMVKRREIVRHECVKGSTRNRLIFVNRHGVLRKSYVASGSDEQQAESDCIGGHGTSPYEQKTQQSPERGRSGVVHESHTYKYRQASSSISSVFCIPHSGHVMVEIVCICVCAFLQRPHELLKLTLECERVEITVGVGGLFRG
jgi:hypothetical protein